MSSKKERTPKCGKKGGKKERNLPNERRKERTISNGGSMKSTERKRKK